MKKYEKIFARSSPLPVKPVFMDIGLCFGRDEIPHRFSSLDQLPDLRRGDIEERDLFEIEMVSRKMNPDLCFEIILKGRGQRAWKLRGDRSFLESWPGHHDEMAEGEEVLKILPGLYFHEGIPSQDEKEGIGAPLTKMAEGVDRIGFPGP